MLGNPEQRRRIPGKLERVGPPLDGLSRTRQVLSGEDVPDDIESAKGKEEDRRLDTELAREREQPQQREDCSDQDFTVQEPLGGIPAGHLAHQRCGQIEGEVVVQSEPVVVPDRPLVLDEIADQVVLVVPVREVLESNTAGTAERDPGNREEHDDEERSSGDPVVRRHQVARRIAGRGGGLPEAIDNQVVQEERENDDRPTKPEPGTEEDEPWYADEND